MEPWVGLQCVTVVFPEHTLLLFEDFKAKHLKDSIQSNMVYISIIFRDSSPPGSMFCVLKQDTLLVQPRKTGNRTDITSKTNDICTNEVCATSKASYQLVHMRGLIRAFTSRMSIL